MKLQTAYSKQINSTNIHLHELMRTNSLPEGFVLRTDFQTAGKGQIGNSWESEKGKNLLFSILLYPEQIAIEDQFVLSQIVSLAMVKVLSEFAEGFQIKWPNDIYWNDKKIAGILIENSLQGGKLKSTVIGVGLNINQKTFLSNAPNPISLYQITGNRNSIKLIMHDICKNILDLYLDLDFNTIKTEYMQHLYRNDGYYSYTADGVIFKAKLLDVKSTGKLVLETDTGEMRGFYFKEVAYLI
jgi:BirA family biotin operon repressor/biotin-[acetyl-CoA-carboxylase] ligase